MKKLGIALVVLVVILAALDIGARIWTQHELASETKKEVPGVASVGAGISSFPFIGHLAFSGTVPHAHLTLHDLPAERLNVDQLRVAVDDFTIDRGKLLDGKVIVTHVSKVDVSAVLTDADLTQASGVAIHISPGQATAQFGGQDVTVQASVSGSQLILSATGVGSVSVTLPSSKYLPCTPQAQLGDGEATLRCTSDHLPDAVVQAIGSVNLRHRS